MAQCPGRGARAWPGEPGHGGPQDGGAPRLQPPDVLALPVSPEVGRQHAVTPLSSPYGSSRKMNLLSIEDVCTTFILGQTKG